MEIVSDVDYKFDKKHIYQINMGMWVYEREWCDYVVYCEKSAEPLFIKRFYRNEEIINDIKVNIEDMKKRIKKVLVNFAKNNK